MRKIYFFVLLFSFLFSAQAQHHSWDGKGISPTSHFRALNIYVNIIYDSHPDANNIFNNTTFWGPVTNTTLEGVNVPGTIPTYLLSLFDTAYIVGNTHGCITRIFGESSFDTLQISGDNVVVNVRESRVVADPTPSNSQYCQTSLFCFNKIKKVAIDVINEAGGLKTIFGHDSLMDYSLPDSLVLFCTNVLIRNITRSYGGINNGSGFGNEPIQGLQIGNNYYSSQVGTLQCIGDGDFSTNPTGVLTHEIGHSLFGGNNFHTSGGNHRGSGSNTMPWMNIQGGYGLMGAAGSGLVCCNGYDRWRMHWKHPASPYYISACNVLDNGFLNSDISKENGSKWFILRDFVTYGDAIRIKMPYKDNENTPNQYIWLEFHNVGHNDKLDFLQFTNEENCLHKGASGIYAYYQIGRDVLESTNPNLVWDQINRDNLRIISNEGFWDYVQYPLLDSTDFVCTGWGWEDCYYSPDYSNAFCGYQDQETFIVPKWYDADLGNTCDTLYMTPLRYDNYSLKYKIREYTARNMIKNGDTVTHNIMFNGDTLDAFSSSHKLNMGTNPSTCNAKTCYTSNNSVQTQLTFDNNAQYNNTATYLTGLSIEMLPISNGSQWLVKIRWDDYDITNDARWTGKIVLKGTEHVNLTRGYSITLAQNRTPAQRLRSSESGYFAEPTELTCEAGSHFTQQPQTSLVLTEKSHFVLDNGATYHLGDSAQILIHGKSSFHINQGADFIGGIASEIIVDSLSILYVYDTVKLRREARIIVRPGGKLIVDGGTLTNACDGEMWEGIIVEGNTNLRQAALAQGSVILNNATIENAHTAISTHRANDSIWVGTGGIVQATNSLFRNNRRTAEFLLYENHLINGSVTDNVSHFTRCTFTIDDNNMFAANGTSFENHVSLWQVRGVRFQGCAFRNEVTGTTGDARGKAIYTIESGFSARRMCPSQPSMDPCSCEGTHGDTVTRSTFEGFYHAVHATSTLGSYDVTVDNCDFSQNGAGVLLSAADNARVSFSDFTLNSNLFLYYALGLDNCTGYTVESNAFHRQTYSDVPIVFGTMVDNSGVAENKIRKNEFLNLSIGCYATGQNSSTKNPGPGLQFECNEFTGCYTDIGVSNGTVRSAQGSSTAGADNDFVSTLNSSINLSSANNINYRYSNGTGHVPLNPSTGVTLTGGATANGCASSLCGVQFPPGPKAAGLGQYVAMGEELSALASEYESRGYGEDLGADEAAAALAEQMSALSSAMGDLSRTEIRRIVSDSVVDMALLKGWYETIVETLRATSLQDDQLSDIPVAVYQLAEVYNGERNWAAAREALASIPARFMLDSADADEYRNYLALQQLRENVEGNWYRQSEREIAELQGVAEHNDGRASRMAKDILCFFHEICYADNLLLDMDGMGERGARRDAIHRVPTTENGAITLYPNPTHNTLTVESTSPIREIAVYDQTGRTVTVETCHGASLQQVVNTSSLHAGIYLLKVITETGIETAKFVKN